LPVVLAAPAVLGAPELAWVPAPVAPIQVLAGTEAAGRLHLMPLLRNWRTSGIASILSSTNMA
jgi:hypothetical protein